MSSEPVTFVEIDVDFCDLTYGTSPCTAILGTTGVRKCHNTLKTCQDTANIDLGTLTLKFAEPSTRLPKGATIFPVLDRVSAFSSTVNISGTDDDLSALGRRATVSVRLQDFTYGDSLTDKYRDERIDGTGQTDEGGYDPAERGTFFGKLKARWPYYAGRPIRIIQGELLNGALTNTKTRHYIITDIQGPNGDGSVTIKGKDVLALADDEKAVAPTPSSGFLAADIDAVATSLTLTPEGIGASYPASGRAVIGSEVVDYIRSVDEVTLTARGVSGTEAKSHNADDTFQEVLSFNATRIDDVINTLLTDYTTVPSSWIPKASKWEPEVDRWGPDTLLTRDITKPTGVAKLIKSLSILGYSIWWDDVNQEIGLKATRPVDGDTVHTFADKDIVSIEQEDRDEDRLTQIHFHSGQIDPTKSETEASNYRVHYIADDPDSETNYGSKRIKEIFCPWFNQGNFQASRIIARRLLIRFRDAPARFKIKVDATDGDVGLTDVMEVTTDVSTDATGRTETKRLQAARRYEPISGHEIELLAQAYEFTGRFGYIMENTANAYGTATDAEKANGAYIVDEATLLFPDATGPYEII